MGSIPHSQIYLPGSTDRVSQLSWVSLADGGSNSVLGYNSGKKLAPSYTNNVLLGTNVAASSRNLSTCVLIGASAAQLSDRLSHTVGLGYGVLQRSSDVDTSTIIGASAGTLLRRTSECVAIGYKCLERVQDGSRNVILGAFGAASASNIGNVVLAGTSVASNAANLEGVVVIGHAAAANMRSATSTVAIGASTARTFRGSYNTIVGATAALNIACEYTTIIGSRNMNRRSGRAVLVSNSVIVGESIQFDNPLTTKTLVAGDALLLSVSGPSTYDFTHPFPEPYFDFSGTGRLVYKIEESREEALIASEQYISFFQSLRLEDQAQYTTSVRNFGTTVDISEINDVIALAGTPPLTIHVSATSANLTHIAANVTVAFQGSLVASKLFKCSSLSFPIDNLHTYIDMTVTWANTVIDVSAVLFQNGVTLASGENGGVVSTLPFYDVTDMATGFQLINVDPFAGTPRPTSLYWDLVGIGGNAAAYTVLQHNQRVDSSMDFETLYTSHSHTTTTGAVDVNRGNNVTDIVLVDSSVNRTGNVSVYYDVKTLVSNVSTSVSFCLTDTAQTAGSFGITVLDQYTLACTVDTIAPNVFTLSLLSATGGTLFDCTDARMYAPFRWSTRGYGTGVPIDLSGIRQAAPDVWAFLDFTIDVDNLFSGIGMRLRLRGYTPTGYISRDRPLISQEYYFAAVDPDPPLSLILYERSQVEFFASSLDGIWSLRDVVIQVSRYLPAPQFENCVFIGSNFTVANIEDRSNVFLLSMGPSKTLMRGTPSVLEIFAPRTSIKGHLTIGDSSSNNYLAFRGTTGDGFIEQVPRTYIGERIYQDATQKSELLLFKGDDAPGSELGPDRVRVLSGQFRVDVPSLSSNSTYQYPGITFDSVGNTSTQPVLVSDAQYGTQFFVANSTPTMLSNNFVGFSLAANNLQLRVHVKGSDGKTRTATLSLSLS